jgi:hypothetical protein
MADFYCSICDFAHKHAYSNEQLSLLIGLMGLSLREALQQRMLREGCAKFFSVKLAKHSMHRPPFSIEVFSPAQEQEVLAFFRVYSDTSACMRYCSLLIATSPSQLPNDSLMTYLTPCRWLKALL